MGLFGTIGNIGKGFLDIGLGVGKFGVDVVHSGYEIAQGDFDDGFEILLGSVQEDLLGQTLQGAFGPEGVVGSVIGTLPEAVRSPGRQVIGPAFEAWDWVMQEVVDRPLGTVATMVNASINGRPDKLFDGSTWATAWNINDKRTLGQSVAAAIYNIDPFDEGEYAKIEDDPLFDLMSGFVDFVQEIYLDPVERFARGAKNFSTGKTVVAVSKTGRLLDKVSNYDDAFIMGRKTARNKLGLELAPERVYVRGGGKGWRPTDASGKVIKSKGIFPGFTTKTLTDEQRAARAMISQPINSLRAQSALNLAWWQRAQQNMSAFDEISPLEDFDYADATNSRLQGLKDAVPRRMAGKGKGMPEQAFALIARGKTEDARNLTFRALMGDNSVWDEIGEFGEEIRDLLSPDENGYTFFEKVREVQNLRKLDEEAKDVEKASAKRKRNRDRMRAKREAAKETVEETFEQAEYTPRIGETGKPRRYFKNDEGDTLPYKMKKGYRSDGSDAFYSLREAIEDQTESGAFPEDIEAWLEKTGLNPDEIEVLWVAENPESAVRYSASLSPSPETIEVPDWSPDIYIDESTNIDEVIKEIEDEFIDLEQYGGAVPILYDGEGGYLYARTTNGTPISTKTNLTDTGALKETVEEAVTETPTPAVVEEAIEENVRMPAVQKTKPVSEWQSADDVMAVVDEILETVARTDMKIDEVIQSWLENNMPTLRQVMKIAKAWDDQNKALGTIFSGDDLARESGRSPFSRRGQFAGTTELNDVGKELIIELRIIEDVLQTIRNLGLAKDGALPKSFILRKLHDKIHDQLFDSGSNAIDYIKGRLGGSIKDYRIVQTPIGPKVFNKGDGTPVDTVPILPWGKAIPEVTDVVTERLLVEWDNYVYDSTKGPIDELNYEKPLVIREGDYGRNTYDDGYGRVLMLQVPGAQSKMVEHKVIGVSGDGDILVDKSPTLNVYPKSNDIAVYRLNEEGKIVLAEETKVIDAEGLARGWANLNFQENQWVTGATLLEGGATLRQNISYFKQVQEGIELLSEATTKGYVPVLRRYSATDSARPVKYEVSKRRVRKTKRGSEGYPEKDEFGSYKTVDYDVIEFRVREDDLVPDFPKDVAPEPVRIISYTTGKGVKGDERIVVHPHLVDQETGKLYELGEEFYPTDLGIPEKRRKSELIYQGKDDIVKIQNQQIANNELLDEFEALQKELPPDSELAELTIEELYEVNPDLAMRLETVINEYVLRPVGDPRITPGEKQLREFRDIIDPERTSRFSIEDKRINEMLGEGRSLFVGEQFRNLGVGIVRAIDKLKEELAELSYRGTPEQTKRGTVVRTVKTDKGHVFVHPQVLEEMGFVTVDARGNQLIGTSPKNLFDKLIDNNVDRKTMQLNPSDVRKQPPKGKPEPGTKPVTEIVEATPNTGKAAAKEHLKAKAHVPGRLTAEDFVETDGVYQLRNAEESLGEPLDIQIAEEDGLFTVIIEGEIIEKRSPIVRDTEGNLVRDGRPVNPVDIDAAQGRVEMQAAMTGQETVEPVIGMRTLEEAVQEANNWYNDFNLDRATSETEAALAREARINELLDEISVGFGKINSVDWETLLDVDYTIKMNMPKQLDLISGDRVGSKSNAELMMDDPEFINRLNIVVELVTGAEDVRNFIAPGPATGAKFGSIETVYTSQYAGYYQRRMATLYARHKELRELGESGAGFSDLYKRAMETGDQIVDDFRITSTLSPLGFRILRVFNQRLPHSLVHWGNTQGVVTQIERVMEQASKVKVKIPVAALKEGQLEKLVESGRASYVEGAATVEVKIIGLDETVQFIGEISRINADGGPIKADLLKNLFERKMEQLAKRGDNLLGQIGVKTERSLFEAYQQAENMKNNLIREDKVATARGGERAPRTKMDLQEGVSEAPIGTAADDIVEGMKEGRYPRSTLSGIDDEGNPFSLNFSLNTRQLKQASVLPRWDLLGKAIDDAVSSRGRSSLKRKGGKSKAQIIEERYDAAKAELEKDMSKLKSDELADRKEKLTKLTEKYKEDLSKLEETDLSKEVKLAGSQAVNALAHGTMTIWRPLVLLTPKWGLRIQLDEVLRRAADIGALTEFTNLIVATRRWKNGLAANGIEFDMNTMFDEITEDASSIAGYGTGKKPAFRKKYGRVYNPESIGDQVRMIQDNLEDFNKINKTNLSTENFQEYFAERAALHARKQAGAKKVYRPAVARGLLGAALIHPVVGTAWGAFYGVRRWQRLNKVADLNARLSIADQLMIEAKSLLREAIDEEDVVLQEIAREMLSRGEGAREFVETLIEKATKRDSLVKVTDEEGKTTRLKVDTDLIVNNVEKADALLEETGFGNLTVNGAVVRNPYGDDQAHREMIASENSASSSQMAAVKGARQFHINEFKRFDKADWETLRLGAPGIAKTEFIGGWKRTANQFSVIGQGFETELLRVVWANESKIARATKLAENIKNSSELRTRLKINDVGKYADDIEESYLVIAMGIVDEFDSLVPYIPVVSEGPTFEKLRKEIRDGKEIVWADVEKILNNPDVQRTILGVDEFFTEPPTLMNVYMRSFAGDLTDDLFVDDVLNELGVTLEEFNKNPEKFMRPEDIELHKQLMREYKTQQAQVDPMNLINVIRDGISNKQGLQVIEPHREFAVANSPNSRTIETGRLTGVGEKVNNFVEEMFNTLGTIPSDELSRHPYFRTKYDREVVRLVSKHIGPDGTVKLNQKTLNEIEITARERALKETKDLLYDLAEESKFGEMTRLIFPFFNAWQEVLTRWGRLATENPAFVAKAWRLYQSPFNFEAIGVTEVEDDEGAKYNVFRLPEYVQSIPKSLRPGVLGDITEQRDIRFSKDGLFSMIQSGIPGFGPLVTVPIRETVLSDPSLEETVGFMFPLGHPEGGIGQRMLSGYLPAWQQNVVNYFFDTPTSERMVQSMALQIYVEREEKGMPINLADELTVNEWITEANERTKQFFMFRAATGLFSPTSTTAISPYYDLMKIAKDYQKEYGIREGDSLFLAEYGEDLFALTARMTRLNDGVAASATSEEARENVLELVQAHPAIGAWLTYSLGGADEEYKFNQAAYRKQQKESISPSDPTKRRERKTVFETLADVEIELGWKKYDEVMTLVRKVQDDNLQAGLPTSLNHSSLIWLRDWKNSRLDTIREEHPQWGVAIDNAGVQRNIVKYVDGFIDALKYPTIAARPSTRHLINYFDVRGVVEEELIMREQQGGSSSLSAKTNSDLLLYWETEREKFGMIPEFQKTYDRYFARDLIPEKSFVSKLKIETMVA